MMKTSDFNFDLPQELIAQDPLEDRSSSRLMVLNKESGEIAHRIFHDITERLPLFVRGNRDADPFVVALCAVAVPEKG